MQDSYTPLRQKWLNGLQARSRPIPTPRTWSCLLAAAFCAGVAVQKAMHSTQEATTAMLAMFACLIVAVSSFECDCERVHA